MSDLEKLDQLRDLIGQARLAAIQEVIADPDNLRLAQIAALLTRAGQLLSQPINLEIVQYSEVVYDEDNRSG